MRPRQSKSSRATSQKQGSNRARSRGVCSRRLGFGQFAPCGEIKMPVLDGLNSPCHCHRSPTLSDMAVTQQFNPVDAEFYQTADDFFSAHKSLALTYDDVTLATLYSEILPRDTQLDTQLAEGLTLNIPIISADMDTVTEARMAIAMGLNCGLGLTHPNMPDKQQLSEVGRVKNHVHGLIQDP